ncbi:natural resistance-associated macrophage protein, putative, partial [Perkinsus marinus ATCC 50983]
SLAGQYVMEGFLGLRIPLWLRLLVTRSIALVPALFVAVWQSSAAGESAASLSAVNDWLNILQSVQLPFALLPLLHFVGDPKVMGHVVNTRMSELLGTLVLVLGVAVFCGYLVLMATAV